MECVSLLLSHGAQANVVDTHMHRTPLMMAALNGQTNAVGQYTNCYRDKLVEIMVLDFLTFHLY